MAKTLLLRFWRSSSIAAGSTWGHIEEVTRKVRQRWAREVMIW
jgi:hypothetical protein